MFLPRRILCSASKTFLVSPVEVVCYYLFSNFPLFLAKQTITKIKVMSKISGEEQPFWTKGHRNVIFLNKFSRLLAVKCYVLPNPVKTLCTRGRQAIHLFFSPVVLWSRKLVCGSLNIWYIANSQKVLELMAL